MADNIAESGAPTIIVRKPQIYTGPKGMTVDAATVLYLRDAATRVRSQRYWGSGVTALVSDLLDSAADAIAAEVTTVTSPVSGHDEEATRG